MDAATAVAINEVSGDLDGYIYCFGRSRWKQIEGETSDSSDEEEREHVSTGEEEMKRDNGGEWYSDDSYSRERSHDGDEDCTVM